MALYGQRFQMINVFEAVLDRFCKMDKPDFIGKAALEKVKAAA